MRALAEYEAEPAPLEPEVASPDLVRARNCRGASEPPQIRGERPAGRAELLAKFK